MLKNLASRNIPFKSGIKVDFVICENSKDTDNLKGRSHRRDQSIKSGERYWLIEEYENGASPPIDLLVYLDKISNPIDQIFSIAYPSEFLESIYCRKNRARTNVNLRYPLSFLSKLAYNIEERCYKEGMENHKEQFISESLKKYIDDILEVSSKVIC